jgi:iron donor protein CyaY
MLSAPGGTAVPNTPQPLLVLSDQDFRQLVSATLGRLLTEADGIESDAVEPRLSEGVLQFDLETGTAFVLSQQVPIRELWLSANQRAWHFVFDATTDRWLERDDRQELYSLLSHLLSERLGVPVVFSP